MGISTIFLDTADNEVAFILGQKVPGLLCRFIRKVDQEEVANDPDKASQLRMLAKVRDRGYDVY